MASILLNNTEINYELKISKKAKRIRISIYNSSQLIITIPRHSSLKDAEEFMNYKAKWIIKKLDNKNKIPEAFRPNRTEYSKYKLQALKLVLERLEYFNQFYGFKYKKISIRNQKTRWGSCSRKGNLNFTYRVVLIPSDLADYIIVHELCHLKEFNHSKNFWELVEKTQPNWRGLRNKLKGLE